jgi:hypothetical protein
MSPTGTKETENKKMNTYTEKNSVPEKEFLKTIKLCIKEQKLSFP